MSTYYFDQFGIPKKWEHVRAVDRLVKLKRTNGSNPWPVIEECIKIWEATRPKEWKSYIIELGKLRATRKDRKFASTKDKVTGGYLRYTLDIPEKVMKMIRCIYNPDELPMNREFFLAWSRKFPQMKVAEKL